MDLTQKSLSAVTSLSNKIFLGSSGTSGFPVTQLQILFNTDVMIPREPGKWYGNLKRRFGNQWVCNYLCQQHSEKVETLFAD